MKELNNSFLKLEKSKWKLYFQFETMSRSKYLVISWLVQLNPIVSIRVSDSLIPFSLKHIYESKLPFTVLPWNCGLIQNLSQYRNRIAFSRALNDIYGRLITIVSCMLDIKCIPPNIHELEGFTRNKMTLNDPQFPFSFSHIFLPPSSFFSLLHGAIVSGREF